MTDTNLECPICYDDILNDTNVKVTLCSHIFHDKCLNDWLKNKSTCPVCRATLHKKNTPANSMSFIMTPNEYLDNDGKFPQSSSSSPQYPITSNHASYQRQSLPLIAPFPTAPPPPPQSDNDAEVIIEMRDSPQRPHTQSLTDQNYQNYQIYQNYHHNSHSDYINEIGSSGGTDINSSIRFCEWPRNSAFRTKKILFVFYVLFVALIAMAFWFLWDDIIRPPVVYYVCVSIVILFIIMMVYSIFIFCNYQCINCKCRKRPLHNFYN